MPAERHGEFERIREIVAGLPAGEGVVLGPGDDAAVLRPREGRDLVVTTDTFIDGRHIRRDLLDANAIGARLAAANLSDLAAMAATPRWATLSITAPADTDAGWLRDIELACARALAAEGAAIVGGNLAAGPGPASWTLTLIGDVTRGAHWSRAGARAGDALAVSGFPGRAAAAVALGLWANPPSLARVPAELAAAYTSPASRVRAALALAETGAVRAAIDLSDGLAGELLHLAGASGLGVVVEEAMLPADAALLEGARQLAIHLSRERAELLPAPEQEIAEQLRFGPSDDYELLLAIEPARLDDALAAARDAGAPLTVIGRFTPGADGFVLRRADGREAPLPGRGYDHFR